VMFRDIRISPWYRNAQTIRDAEHFGFKHEGDGSLPIKLDWVSTRMGGP
jgi:hypothetical protein